MGFQNNNFNHACTSVKMKDKTNEIKEIGVHV